MKNCPYCNEIIEDNWTFCHYCDKPLIVNIDRNLDRSIGNNYDKITTQEQYYQEKSLAFDDEIEKRIKKIDASIEEEQLSGGSIGELLLKKASLYYKNRDFSESLKILELALNNFTEEDDFLNIAICHNEMGLIHEDNGFYNDAIYHFEISIENLKKINEIKKLILVYNNTANIFYLLKDLEHAYEYYDKALKLAKQESIMLEVKTSSNLVDILFALKEYEKIARILNRNLEYFKHNNDYHGIIISMIKIGKLNYHLGPNYYDSSLKALTNSLNLIDNLKIQDDISTFVKAKLNWEGFLYLGKLYLSQNQYNEAENYFLRSLEAIRTIELGEEINEALILKNLAKLYVLNGTYQSAIDFYNLSIEIYYKFGEDDRVAQIKYKKALINLNHLQNDTEVIKNFEEALDIFEDLSYIKESAEILHQIGDIYINKGLVELAVSNWTRAKNYYQEFQDKYNTDLLDAKINSTIESNSNSI